MTASSLPAWARALGEAGHRIKYGHLAGKVFPSPDEGSNPWAFTCMACGQTYASNDDFIMPEIQPCTGEKR